jgi:hypothetical protein
MKEEECDCGGMVKGVNDAQLKHNLSIHKKSKRHKELMEIKKRLEK